MLIKVGSLYLTLGTFNYRTTDKRLFMPSGDEVRILPEEAAELEHILEQIIEGQSTIKAQSEELAMKLQQVAQYEKELMQKAAQVDTAYAAMQQQKSPMILPPGFGRKGRG